jgi:hypothetical protein
MLIAIDSSMFAAGHMTEACVRESEPGGNRRRFQHGRLEEAPVSIWKRYGFAWVTLGFFLVTLIGHWLFGWFAYVQDQVAHQQPILVSGYAVLMMRDTLENWQSEFLQLVWQVAGLAILLHVGSPQSKEGDDRMEAKIDAILMAVQPRKSKDVLHDIDTAYQGRHTDIQYVERLEKSRRQ